MPLTQLRQKIDQLFGERQLPLFVIFHLEAVFWLGVKVQGSGGCLDVRPFQVHSLLLAGAGLQ